jgi:hypothetical protein
VEYPLWSLCRSIDLLMARGMEQVDVVDEAQDVDGPDKSGWSWVHDPRCVGPLCTRLHELVCAYVCVLECQCVYAYVCCCEQQFRPLGATYFACALSQVMHNHCGFANFRMLPPPSFFIGFDAVSLNETQVRWIARTARTHTHTHTHTRTHTHTHTHTRPNTRAHVIHTHAHVIYTLILFFRDVYRQVSCPVLAVSALLYDPVHFMQSLCSVEILCAQDFQLFCAMRLLHYYYITARLSCATSDGTLGI